MAISHTMSNPNDNWMQFYQTNFSNIDQDEPPPPTTTTTASIAVATSSRNNNLSPDQGRVSKPLRRRSRASRRTPTTLLNTDTTNFRAMVQQFTGGPAAQLTARPQLHGGGATTFSFMAPPTGSPASGFHVQYQNQALQQQQQHNMYMIDNNMHGGGRGASHAPPGPPSTSVNANRDNYML